MNAPLSFVIFGQGRTGSTLLTSLLSSHPEIQCDGEILGEKVKDPFNQIAKCAAVSRKPVYGFKVKIYQLTDNQSMRPDTFLQNMAAKSVKILFLSRRNHLRQVISNRLAVANQYHYRIVKSATCVQSIWILRS
jgi:LPS sulfotransferase NodH